VISYWRDRARQHTSDSYAGVPLSKFPEDLRVYEHLLWKDRPDTVLEIGTQFGGSALWFRDRLRMLEAYGLVADSRVVTIDIDQGMARHALGQADPAYADTIRLVEGDVRYDDLLNAVEPLVGRRCFVVEDSAHEYDTTWAALERFSPLVAPGGYFVVEDGCVDIEEMRLADDWPRGVLPALRDWLTTEPGKDFRVRRDLELYGMTCHPGGFLQRRA
jgi:cephalosporin hydroxylase